MKVMYNDKLVYKVIWEFFGITLWKDKEALIVYHVHNVN